MYELLWSTVPLPGTIYIMSDRLSMQGPSKSALSAISITMSSFGVLPKSYVLCKESPLYCVRMRIHEFVG